VRLYPAVDILGGSAVRLVQGDFAAKTVYDGDPLAAARNWTDAGARSLHVVDLDGAKTGQPVNLDQLRRITRELDATVQFGGGLRSARAVEQALDAGASRVILGTAAFSDPDLLRDVLEAYGRERVLVSVDVRGGHVATAGWTQTTATRARDAFAELRAQGVSEFVFTNIDRDGMLDGASRDEAVSIAHAAGEGSVIYSGGIGALSDLQELADLRREHQLESLAGVIVGKALYEGRFTVAEAQAVLEG
jgi:phosphoribosylformimino-5-aminoimidazole carboxamide ribotide isomerase